MPSTPPNIGTSVLRTLHRIHRQLSDLTERLNRGPKQVRATEANVKHREELLNTTKAEAKKLRMAADHKQLQLKSHEDKIKELRVKLNGASNNREYQALLDQIAADEMAKSVLEDEILDAMEKADAFKINISEAESALAAAQQKSKEIHASVAEQQPIIQADIAKVEAELQQNEATLPSDVRESYQRIVRQKGEDALAVVENQFCGGCNQQIPLNLLNKVMLGQPAFCKTCGRLLYLPE
jgi:predicted  nucleic acid-binding Zn-ribbon protein